MWWLAGCAPPPVELDPRETGAEVCADCLATAPRDPEQRLGYHRVQVDDEGRAFVTWGLADRDRIAVLTLSVVDDDGGVRQLEVPTTGEVFAGVTEAPTLALGDGVLGVAFTSVDPYRHGDARSVWRTLGTREGGEVGFGAPELVAVVAEEDLPEAPPGARLVVEHANLAFDGDEPWVLWKRQVWGETDQAVWARAGDGWVTHAVSPELSTQHDCSPPDFRIVDGQPLLALRSHVEHGLQTVVVTGDHTGFDTVRQVSSDRYPYTSEVCPEDGPRVLRRADGTLVAAWIAPSGDAPRLHVATSDDGGATWSAPRVDTGAPTFGQRRVSLAESPEGELLFAVEAVELRTELLHGLDGPRGDLRTSDDRPLQRVELAAGGGRLIAVGLDEHGDLRWVEPAVSD